MKRIKLQLLMIALVVFAASSAFASLSYDVSIDTSSLMGTGGYLYFQYNTGINQTGTTTATVQNFAGGILGAMGPNAFDNSGTHVSGTLPGSVSFTNGYVATNDYNQAIAFGNNLNFSLLLPTGTHQNAGSTFSLGLFSDENGSNPLLTTDGTLYTISLMNNGKASTQILANEVTVTPTPIPAAAWLFGSGLMGLAGVRRKMKA